MSETLPPTIIKALETISNATSWDNWEVEEVDGVRNSDSQSNYWLVSEVLHCKLEQLIEDLSVTEDSEHHDTIDQLQTLLQAIQLLEPSYI